MSQLEPYLFFDGNCAEAMRFYEKALDGKLEMLLTAAESPVADQKCKAKPDAVMHACVVVDGRRLMASDWMAEEPYPGIRGVSVSLVYPTVDEARRKFDALLDGGKTCMPLEKTFWVEAFGMLVDRFGTSWMVSGGRQFA